LQALVESLEDRGLLQNTLIVISSDHGEGFGENGRLDHGHDLTMPVIHVPLVFWGPERVPAGVRVADAVEARHIAATILDLVGVGNTAVGGESLDQYWVPEREPGSGQQWLVTHQAVDNGPGVASLVTDSLHFLRDDNGRERLFRYRDDPLELNDLSGDPAHAGLLDSLRLELRSRLAQARQ
jgi:arylsulfatase A-like enzyme